MMREDSVFAALTSGVAFKRRRTEPSKQEPAANGVPAADASQPQKKQRAATEAPDISLFSGSAPAHHTVSESPVVRTNDPHEAANVLRKQLRIKVTGGSPPPPLASFEELRTRYGCGAKLFANLEALGFAEPTAIQRQAIPALLQGRQLLAAAPTGSGKTLAFLLPVIMAVQAERYKLPQQTEQPAPATHRNAKGSKAAATAKQANGSSSGKKQKVASKTGVPPQQASETPSRKGQGPSKASPEAEQDAAGGVRALVLSPTKELAAQSARVLMLLLPGTAVRATLLTGSTAAGTDFSKTDILLATPLHLEVLLKEGRLSLAAVRHLILDEADKLLDLQFAEQVDAAIAACNHPDVVRALFSATLPEAVEELARSVLAAPLRITVGERGAAVSTVRQRLLFVGNEAGKLLALRAELKGGALPLPALVFVSSKDRAKQVLRELRGEKLHVDAIHADQSQAARHAAVEGFRSGRTWVLIATDLLGRGMDLAVKSVVNYDFPASTADYVHRVGRTGRAGRTGDAVTLYTEEDREHVRSIANIIRASGGEVPEWMLQLKKVRNRDPWRVAKGKIGAAGDQEKGEPDKKNKKKKA